MLDSRHSTLFEAREIKFSPARKTINAQAPADHAVALQSPSGVLSTQTLVPTGSYPFHKSPGADMSHTSAEQARPRDLTEGTGDDVVQIQNGNSAVMKRKKQDEPSIVSTASLKDIHTRLENKNAMRDHTASDDCQAETQSNALVLRRATVLFFTSETFQGPMTPVGSRAIQDQSQ